ncbi:MAG: hypothetical protein WAV41_04495 [Microgenomates group bacterium]
MGTKAKIIGGVFLWIIVLNWKNGLGLNIDWWVYILAIGLWWGYNKNIKFSWIFLFILFFLNLSINHLFGFSQGGFSFDWEKINLTHPSYLELIDKYRYDDVAMFYRLRMIFYQPWLTVFLWIDSTLKILSPIFWTRVLGIGGTVLLYLGLLQTYKNYWWWLLTVTISSGLGILIDTKTAVILALPAVILTMVDGYKNFNLKKYGGFLILIFLIDLIIK